MLAKCETDCSECRCYMREYALKDSRSDSEDQEVLGYERERDPRSFVDDAYRLAWINTRGMARVRYRAKRRRKRAGLLDQALCLKSWVTSLQQLHSSESASKVPFIVRQEHKNKYAYPLLSSCTSCSVAADVRRRLHLLIPLVLLNNFVLEPQPSR